MILCCGEALIDMLPRGLANGGSGFSPHAGGAVFNTAIALGRLGVPTGFLSGLSTDFFGETLSAALAASGVDTRYAIMSDRPTTLAFVRLVNGQASYLFYDENSAGRMLHEADLPHLGPDVAALHFGAISLIGEPCGTAYEALMAREFEQRVIMLDPNIRPGFIREPARHRARMFRMAGMADIVKLSDEDLAWFAPGRDMDAAVGRWFDLGPKLVVITRGANGARAYTKSGMVEVAAPAVAVVDTVGAGDTFNAGLLAHLHEAGRLDKASLAALDEQTLRASLHRAVQVAAVTVSRAGANPPWRTELG